MSSMPAPAAQQQRDYFATHELDPTDDNIITSLTEDKFGRNEYLKHFLCFLDHINYSCSIAIDGQWGSGKSFFVKQAKAVFECCNPQISEEDSVIESMFSSNLAHSFLPIYYDAWANDNANDPFISLIHTIATNPNIQKEDFSQKQAPFLKKAVTLVDALCGTGLKDFYELKDPENMLEEIKKIEKTKDEIKVFFQDCMGTKKKKIADRMIIFVDELDRCKPGFAVQLLERIKHYFSFDDVTFVLSINSVELEHTIKAFYGQDFDAHRYLDRFFDYRVELPLISVEQYVEAIKGEKDLCSVSVLISVIQQYKLSIREIEKLYRAITAASGKNRAQPLRVSDESINALFYSVLLPVIYGVKMTNSTLYRQFISGSNFQPLTAIIQSSNSVKNYLKYMAEDMDSCEIETRIKNTLLDDENEWKHISELLYGWFFSPRNNNLEMYLNLVNMLSPYASYH